MSSLLSHLPGTLHISPSLEEIAYIPAQWFPDINSTNNRTKAYLKILLDLEVDRYKKYKLDVISFGKENLKLNLGYSKSKDSSLTTKKWSVNNLKPAF